MKNCKYLKQKINHLFECKLNNKIINIKECSNCLFKEYSLNIKHVKNTNNKSKRTKKLSITKKVKLIVWERDEHKCIFCGCLVSWNLANSHFIKRSHGGLGIEQNIFCACLKCHHLFDDSIKRKYMLIIAENHLKSKYDNWNIVDLIYQK